MRTAFVVPDIEECFHTSVGRVLVIRAQGGQTFEDIRRPFKKPFSPDIQNTPGFVIDTDAMPVFLRR